MVSTRRGLLAGLDFFLLLLWNSGVLCVWLSKNNTLFFWFFSVYHLYRFYFRNLDRKKKSLIGLNISPQTWPLSVASFCFAPSSESHHSTEPFIVTHGRFGEQPIQHALLGYPCFSVTHQLPCAKGLMKFRWCQTLNSSRAESLGASVRNLVADKHW